MSAASTTSAATPPTAQGATVSSWVELTKPRITVLMLITCWGAMFTAASGLPSLALFVATSVGLALSTGGASALNHVYDRDIDRIMSRTRTRPVAAGQISSRSATFFGAGLMITGFAELALTVNFLSASLALAGGLFYVVVYTVIMKRRTVHNTVAGGIAGAIPPLVGWAAVSGDLNATLPWILFLIMFTWQPAHFWALSLLIREDYAKANVPMLPVVSGERATVRATWHWTIAAIAVSILPLLSGDAGLLYLAAAVPVNFFFLGRVLKLRAAMRHVPEGGALITEATEGRAGEGRQTARGAFLGSMVWLALLFAALVIDVVA